MSGALKHFFDTLFLEIGGALAADGAAGPGGDGGRATRKPFGLWVHGRYDTSGAVRSVLSITGALPWSQAAPVLEVLGDVDAEQEAAAYELGGDAGRPAHLTPAWVPPTTITRWSVFVSSHLPSCSRSSACGGQAPATDRSQVNSVEAPELGACRVLTPDDVQRATNATSTVPCARTHTAQTYAVGELPAELADAGYTDQAVSEFAFRTCSEKFQTFLGADESLAMRTVVTWAWFRPSEKAWDDGARWYRCDVVGGSDQTPRVRRPPEDRQGPAVGARRRPVDGLRLGPVGLLRREGPVRPSRTTGGP